MQMLWLFPRNWSLEARFLLDLTPEVSGPLVRVLQQARQGDLDGALGVTRQAVSEGTPDPEEWHLLFVALLNLSGQPEQGHTVALQHLPFFALDRWGQTMTYLLLAQSLALLGHHRQATHLCEQAEAGTNLNAARSLRLPARLMWAAQCAQNGDPEQARARLQSARRLVRGELDETLWQDTAGDVQALSGEVIKSLSAYSAVLAQRPFPLHEAQVLRRMEQVKTLLFQSPSPALPVARRTVEVRLIGDVALVIDGQRLGAQRDVRTLLLLAYLQVHDGASLSQVADMLLPATPQRDTIKTSLEDRLMARVRGLVARARTLLGDPACIRVDGGALSLSGRYYWGCDVTQALDISDLKRLSDSLQCRWLKEIVEYQSS